MSLMLRGSGTHGPHEPERDAVPVVPGREDVRRAVRLHGAFDASQLTVAELWLRYFALGGEASEMEVDAYLNGMPEEERDRIVRDALHSLRDRALARGSTPAPTAARVRTRASSGPFPRSRASHRT